MRFEFEWRSCGRSWSLQSQRSKLNSFVEFVDRCGVIECLAEQLLRLGECGGGAEVP